MEEILHQGSDWFVYPEIFFKTIFNEMTIYILKGCSASQNKLLIIYMKLDQIKGLNYHKISSTHPNNTTNKC